MNVRNLWHHARPRRATPYRRTVGATVLFSLTGYAGVWSLHIGTVPGPPLSRLLLRTTFQEVVHGQRIKPQLGFHRFVLG